MSWQLNFGSSIITWVPTSEKFCRDLIHINLLWNTGFYNFYVLLLNVGEVLAIMASLGENTHTARCSHIATGAGHRVWDKADTVECGVGNQKAPGPVTVQTNWSPASPWTPLSWVKTSMSSLPFKPVGIVYSLMLESTTHTPYHKLTVLNIL